MIEAFPDRRERLFGRIADIHHLTDRARQPGLTAVVARPLMGKTWTLIEVARQLLKEDRFLVGYHESTGSESSHLLYAVSNLYACWLAESSMREQALDLWKQYKDSLVPRIGQMVGVLFEKLAGKQLPVAGVVRAAFDGLAKAQEDLLSGGLQLAPLPYDQALSLTELVAKVSERRIVLILDAWEKSPSLRPELATLESYLKHPEQWAHTHILLGVRNPERDAIKRDEAYQQICKVCEINGALKDQLHELAPISYEDAEERARLLRYIREAVPAAQDVSDRDILELIDGFPGVLDFWTNEASRRPLRTREDLRQKAQDAQAFRYLELEHQLTGLQDESSRILAARLAFFPRLDYESWAIFRNLLLTDQTESSLDALMDANLLVEERFPTYGHDTRHVAARQWFIKHNRPLIRRVSERLIDAMASRITGANAMSGQLCAALMGVSETARQVGVDPTISCLTDAARTFFGDFERVLNSEFDSLYRDAIQRNASAAPLIAIALLERGGVKGRQGDLDGEIADDTAAIGLPYALVEQMARALVNRGTTKSQQGDSDGAISDFTAAIDLPNAPSEAVAGALVNRGNLKDQQGNPDGAISDFTAAIDLPNAPTEAIALALVNRSIKKGQQGDIDGEIADCTAVIALPDAPAEQVAKALVNRAVRKGQQGDIDGEIVDYTATIAVANAPAKTVATALLGRGIRKGQRGDLDGEISDCTAAITLPDAPTEQVAGALLYRGLRMGLQGNVDEEIADYTAVIALPDASAYLTAHALLYRGIRKGARGDLGGEITDLTAVIALPDAPAAVLSAATDKLENLKRRHRADQG